MPQALNDYKRDLQRYLAVSLEEQFPGIDGQAIAESVVAHINIVDSRPQMFSLLVCHEGVTAMRYDIAAALKTATAAAGTFAGSPTRLQIGVAIIAALLALRGLREPVPNDVARVVLALHVNGGTATLERLADLVGVPPMAARQLDDAIVALAAMRAITRDGGIISLTETVLADYTRLPRITPQ